MHSPSPPHRTRTSSPPRTLPSTTTNKDDNKSSSIYNFRLALASTFLRSTRDVVNSQLLTLKDFNDVFDDEAKDRSFPALKRSNSYSYDDDNDDDKSRSTYSPNSSFVPGVGKSPPSSPTLLPHHHHHHQQQQQQSSNQLSKNWLSSISRPRTVQTPVPKRSLSLLLGTKEAFKSRIASRSSSQKRETLSSRNTHNDNNEDASGSISVTNTNTTGEESIPNMLLRKNSVSSFASLNSRRNSSASRSRSRSRSRSPSRKNSGPSVPFISEREKRVLAHREKMRLSVRKKNATVERNEDIEILKTLKLDEISPRTLNKDDEEEKFVRVKDTFYDSDLDEVVSKKFSKSASELKLDALSLSSDSSSSLVTSTNHRRRSSNPINARNFSNHVSLADKTNFTQLTRTVANRRLQIPPSYIATNDTHPSSTITKYITYILSQNRFPLSLILKHQTIKTLNLNGLGSGDDYGIGIAICLPYLRDVEELNFNDNRFTDVSIEPILRNCMLMENLTKLDLSNNDMDILGAVALRDLLGSSTTLVWLELNHCDVDDNECVALMECLEGNTVLKTLSLSDNFIGVTEMLNTCQPEHVTGPEAASEMFKKNTTLTSLSLSWNSIRSSSALALARSLAFNTGLEVLNLSNNGFGSLASQELGKSLGMNRSLKSLDVSYNQISISAAMVIASGITTSALDFLILDGNNIGRLGSEAIIAAVRHGASDDKHLEVSFTSCDVSCEGIDLFDSQYPTKPNLTHPKHEKKNPGYTLDLETPYGYMVACELLKLANTKEGCSFTSVKHSLGSGKKAKATVIKLERGPKSIGVGNKKTKNHPWEALGRTLDAKDTLFNSSDLATAMQFSNMNPSEQLIFSLFNKISKDRETSTGFYFSGLPLLEDKRDAAWEIVLHALFTHVDPSNSHRLDCSSMLNCLNLIGVTPPPTSESVAQVIACYDVNDSGYIERSEFIAYALSEFASSPPVVMSKLFDTRNTKEPWTIPRIGTLLIDYIGLPSVPTVSEIGSDHGVYSLIRNIEGAKDEGERRALFEVATRDGNIFFTSAQATQLVNETAHGQGRVDAVRMVVTQMSSTQEAVKLVESNLNWEERCLLRIMMGNCYKPIMGLCSGHYNLDYSKPQDRTAAKKIAEIAASEKRFSMSSQCGRNDTSQTGNYENYRNGHVDGESTLITSAYFGRYMNVGRVKFDYVSTSRPKRGAKAMCDDKFDLMLVLVGIKDANFQSDVPDFFATHVSEQDVWNHWEGWQKSSHYASIVERAWNEKKKYDILCCKNIARVMKKSMTGRKRKGKKKGKDDSEVATPKGSASATPKTGMTPKNGSPKAGNNTPKKNLVMFGSDDEESESEDELKPGEFKCIIGDDFETYTHLNLLDGPSELYKACYCALLKVETAVAGKTLSCEQAKTIVFAFPDEDGIRVEVLCSLFSRVIDIENYATFIIDEIDKINPQEREEAYFRIGIGNLFSVFSPDRAYHFDLKARDEREVITKLIALGGIEDGVNMTDVLYRRRWNIDPIPGLGIPSDWVADPESIPREFGDVKFTYVTESKVNAGTGKVVSLADVGFRKEMYRGCFGNQKRVF